MAGCWAVLAPSAVRFSAVCFFLPAAFGRPAEARAATPRLLLLPCHHHHHLHHYHITSTAAAAASCSSAECDEHPRAAAPPRPVVCAPSRGLCCRGAPRRCPARRGAAARRRRGPVPLRDVPPAPDPLPAPPRRAHRAARPARRRARPGPGAGRRRLARRAADARGLVCAGVRRWRADRGRQGRGPVIAGWGPVARGCRVACVVRARRG